MNQLTFKLGEDTDLGESRSDRLERVKQLIEYAVSKIVNAGNLDEADYALNLCRHWLRRGLVAMPASVKLSLLGAERHLASARGE